MYRATIPTLKMSRVVVTANSEVRSSTAWIVHQIRPPARTRRLRYQSHSIRVATPPGYEPFPEIVDRARRRAEQTGGRILLTNDPAQAVSGADAVYADVWTSMGREAEAEQRKTAFAGFTIDARLMERASRTAIFLHCLPAHRGEEVTDAVMDGPASRVWPQAANRLHTETALLYAVVTGDFAGALLA